MFLSISIFFISLHYCSMDGYWHRHLSIIPNDCVCAPSPNVRLIHSRVVHIQRTNTNENQHPVPNYILSAEKHFGILLIFTTKIRVFLHQIAFRLTHSLSWRRNVFDGNQQQSPLAKILRVVYSRSLRFAFNQMASG